MTRARVLAVGAGLLVLLVAGLLIAQLAGSGDGGPSHSQGPSETTSSSPTPSESSTPKSPKAQVKAAYLRQWTVLARAVRTLQTRQLAQVFTGRALGVVRAQVQQLRHHHRAVRVRVKHHIRVKLIDANTALVLDRYINHSVTINPRTGAPTEKVPSEVILDAYTLKKVDGTWKVSGIARKFVHKRHGS